MHVLIIEDDPVILQFLTETLKELDSNLHISISNSATESFTMAKKQKFDLFIVDIQLVDYKGTDLVKQLRSIQTYKYTPIIFETAIVTEELNAYRELKCYHYLIKPYTKEEVKKVIREVLEYLQQSQVDEQKIRIEQKGFIFEYRFLDILYIESFGKKMVFHLLTESNKIRQEIIAGYSLKAMMELLQDGPFVQCHKSFILNKNYIEVIQKAENLVKLRYCTSLLPIGNKYREHFLECWK